jgi:hypothetical protein
MSCLLRATNISFLVFTIASIMAVPLKADVFDDKTVREACRTLGGLKKEAVEPEFLISHCIGYIIGAAGILAVVCQRQDYRFEEIIDTLAKLSRRYDLSQDENTAAVVGHDFHIGYLCNKIAFAPISMRYGSVLTKSDEAWSSDSSRRFSAQNWVGVFAKINMSKTKPALEMLETPPLSPETSTTNVAVFTCDGIDDNSTYMTIITIVRDNSTKLKNFEVSHVTFDGLSYTRSRQYKQVRFWDDKNYSVSWSGKNIKDPTKTMTGQLTPGLQDNALYVEILREGKKETTFRTSCALDFNRIK